MPICCHAIKPRAAAIVSVVTLFLVAFVANVGQADDGTEDVSIEFNRDIRPILSENCFHCHGPDEDKRAADLRLDVRDEALDVAFTPGDADNSELIARVISDDPYETMPPPDSNRSLTKKQKELLTAWVNQGGEYQSHWSFRTPAKPTAAEHLKTPTAIDRFVSAAIKKAGLKPSPQADRQTLIRRVTFDLTGLPPTTEEIDQFLADTDDDAFEKVIDRLLASPRYGERMTSDWLDVARYSDTYGYQQDRDRYVWPWRDWVVDAFNRNLGYDDFITQQLAGDLLPDATSDQILATTFNRLHPQKVEGGSVPEEFRIEYVADRTQTVATGLLGLTYECCRCHSHKYDPISQKEYYQLSAYFDKIDEAGLYSFFTDSVPTPTMVLPTEDQKNQLVKAELALETAIGDFEELAKKSADEIPKLAESTSIETLLASFAKPVEQLEFDDAVKGPNSAVEGVFGTAVKLTGDDPVNTKVGNFRRDQPFSISLWLKTPDVKERAVIFHRSRAWTDAASRGYQLLIEDGRLSWSLIHFWPGNAIRIRATESIPVDQWQHVVVSNDGSSTAAGMAIYVDGKRVETEVVRDSLTKNITGGGGDNIAIGQRFRDRGFTGGAVDRFTVYDQQLTELEISQLARRDEQSDKTGDDDFDVDLVHTHVAVRLHEPTKKAVEAIAKKRRACFEIQDKLQEIMVMKQAPVRRDSYLLQRGVYDNRGSVVEPGTPAALLPFPDDEPNNRLGLARWMTDPKHPLTSRVAVNRLWQICFGSGIVRTPEDFGSQGSPPTHPKLLDYLAVDFVENNWDMKRMLKQIMLSETYGRSSRPADRATADADPENKWLAHFPSYRLPAEMLRDNVLFVSGQLVEKKGGPPVKPYEIEASFKPSKRNTGEGLYRRSLYTYWRRTGPAPAMLTFDAAKRDVCRVKRERTSSPLQSLVMLNGPQYVEAARSTANRLMQQHAGKPSDQIRKGYRTLTSRDLTDDELAILKNLYDQQKASFQKSKEQATAYLSVGDAKFDEKHEPADLAALSVVISTLMNFDASVTKR